MRSLRVASIAVLAIWVAGCSRPESPVTGPDRIPETAYPTPGFSIPRLDGQEGSLSLADYKGKVVLLDFWATWCPPCRHELPYLNKMHNDLKDKGFALIGMTVDQVPTEELAAAVAKFELTYPVGHAGEDVMRAYGNIRAIPTKFLLDKEGNVRKSYEGVQREADLRADIEALLAM